MLQRGKEAKEKASVEFSGISLAQLNWKPSDKSWSIAQCLHHLVMSHSAYFSQLEKITTGTFQMNIWQRYSPLSSTLGRLMKDRMQEQPKIKMKAPKIIQPSSSEFGMDIIEDYHKNLDRFLAYISNCKTVDIDKTIISSPVTSIVTYSLRDTITFLVQHEHRHLNQAIRVKTNARFPK